MASYIQRRALYFCANRPTLALERLHTKKGAFFSVSTPFAEKTEVKVIDRQAALKILDDNPGGIINENYIKVFGNVEIG